MLLMGQVYKKITGEGILPVWKKIKQPIDYIESNFST
jgi:hypothetical protein